MSVLRGDAARRQFARMRYDRRHATPHGCDGVRVPYDARPQRPPSTPANGDHARVNANNSQSRMAQAEAP